MRRCVCALALALCVSAVAAQWGRRGGRRQMPQREEEPVQDHYAILGVEKTATQKEIRRAYRKLSVKYHPDKNKEENAQQMFDAVADAYEVLGDADARELFDNFGGKSFHSRREFEIAKQQGKVKEQKGGFYQNDALVLTLGNHNYGKTGRGPWLVKFYAPWCHHCQQSAPDFKKAALHLEGEVNFGAVNCDEHQYTCNRNRIFSYPTLVFIDHKKDLKEVYQAPGGEDHSVDALTRFVMQAKTNRMVNLTPQNFQEKVIDSKTLWLVDYSAGEWCGPCTMTKPAARKAASELHGIAKVGYINCDGENQEFCSEQGVGYYPFLMVYPRGGPEMKREKKKELEGGQFPKQMLLDIFAATAKASLEFREGWDDREWRERLMTFYEDNNPEKIEMLNKIIDAYLGEEDYLWKQLHQKYELPYTPLEDIMKKEQEELDKMRKAGHSEL